MEAGRLLPALPGSWRRELPSGSSLDPDSTVIMRCCSKTCLRVQAVLSLGQWREVSDGGPTTSTFRPRPDGRRTEWTAGVEAMSSYLPASPELDTIRTAGQAVRALHALKVPPRPGDWLEQHREPGQTFDDYRASDPNRATVERTTIYLQPFGEFDAAQSRLIAATADLLGRFYGVPVKTLDRIGLDAIPDSAHRIHPTWGDHQILTSCVLDLLREKETGRCRRGAGANHSGSVARQGLELRLRPGVPARPGGRLVAVSPRRSPRRVHHLSAPHAQDCRSRDGPYAGDSALHDLRVRDERLEPSGGSGCEAALVLSRGRDEGLVGQPGRSG